MFDKQLFDAIERNLYHITFYFCSSWGFENGWKMIVSGDYGRLEKLVDENCILVANHQNTCDISALMWPLVTLNGLKGAVTWIMDAIFKLSSFGWVCLGHDDFFIWQQADAKQFKFAAPCDPEHIKEHELARLAEYCRTNFTKTSDKIRNWLLIFPEGGFRYKRQQASNKYATKNNLPQLSYVTYPRHGAVYTAAKSANFKHIIDATLCYENEKEACLWNWWLGNAQTVRIHFTVTDIPSDMSEENVQEKLTALWARKELMLSHFSNFGFFPKLVDKPYVNGNIPQMKPVEEQKIHLNIFKVLLYKFIYLATSVMCVTALTVFVNIIMWILPF